MGRVAITHSTYLEGLIAVLRALALEDGVDTVTPAVISRVRGHAQTLRMRVSTPISGGFKVLARRGSTAQEVFVVTSWDRDRLQDRLDRLCEKV
jgi:hypothetical protein